ncbi:MAG: membrane protein insertase YidC [Clostridia bacterium]|nr:membrane protein insertase YidC [Clostridia bacterium]
MIDAIVDFMGRLLLFFYLLTESLGAPNYGLAIIIFTFFIKLILFPLTRKQYVSMAKMQEIQPELQRIQKKYKNNPEKSQQEMMKLYQKHGVNPFAGCLPIFIQLPILLALFKALKDFFDPQRHPDFVNIEMASFLWVPNLGSPDPIFLPILVAVSTFVQQKVSMHYGAAGGPGESTQKVLLYFMPIFIGYISRTFPAGLALYWVMYSLFGIIEQVLIKKKTVVVKEEAGKK